MIHMERTSGSLNQFQRVIEISFNLMYAELN